MSFISIWYIDKYEQRKTVIVEYFYPSDKLSVSPSNGIWYKSIISRIKGLEDRLKKIQSTLKKDEKWRFKTKMIWESEQILWQNNEQPEISNVHNIVAY